MVTLEFMSRSAWGMPASYSVEFETSAPARKNCTNWSRAPVGPRLGFMAIFAPLASAAFSAPVTVPRLSKSCSGDSTFTVMWLNNWSSVWFPLNGLLVRW